MKVYYRGPVIIGCIQLLILSFLALYIVFNIVGGNDLFLQSTIVKSLYDLKFYAVLIIFSSVLLINLKKISLYIFGLTGLSFLIYNLIFLWVNFNKLSLVFLSIFTTLFFYFYHLLKSELSNAYVRPYFLRNYVGGKPQLVISVVIRSQSQKLDGFLGNWDNSGCYIYLDEEFNKVDREIWIDFPYENRTFQDKGIVATLSKDRKGLGVYIPNKRDLSEERKFKWKSFIRILKDRGFTPSRIK